MEKSNKITGAIEGFIGKNYMGIGEDLLNAHRNRIMHVIHTRSIPEEGMEEQEIRSFIDMISNMDSNNGPSHIGIGEREGRIISPMVHGRNYGLVHGMGRSGDVNELQPKAVGSSFLVQLTKAITKNLLQSIGLSFINNLLILPFATGMSLTISFLTLHQSRPNAKYILWPRIDQKTCLKCIFTANLIPIIIQPIIKGDELVTDINEIKKQIEALGKENILGVFSTTSGFAPRGIDSIADIALICKDNDLYHIINNAYGIYCGKISDMITQANAKGRVDLIVSSLDKNFMVPIGGSVIYSSNEKLVDLVKKNYPGRASLAPVLDLFVSFMQMGKKKYKEMIKQRRIDYDLLKEKVKEIAKGYGERVLELPNNKISIGMTIGAVCAKGKVDVNVKREVTELGALFYSRQISGVRVIAKSEEIDMNGYKFKNYGSSCEEYPYLPYMTFACAIGISAKEIKDFIVKFPKVIDEFIKEKITVKEIGQVKTDNNKKKKDNKGGELVICSNYNITI